MAGKREGMDNGKIMYLYVVTLLWCPSTFFKAFCCSNHAKHTTEGCGNKSLCVKPHVGYYAVGSVVTVFPILNIKGYILRGALKRQ